MAFEQLKTIAKEKWEEITTSSPDQDTTVAKEKPKEISASVPDPKATALEIYKSSKNKSAK